MNTFVDVGQLFEMMCSTIELVLLRQCARERSLLLTASTKRKRSGAQGKCHQMNMNDECGILSFRLSVCRVVPTDKMDEARPRILYTRLTYCAQIRRHILIVISHQKMIHFLRCWLPLHRIGVFSQFHLFNVFSTSFRWIFVCAGFRVYNTNGDRQRQHDV